MSKAGQKDMTYGVLEYSSTTFFTVYFQQLPVLVLYSVLQYSER